MIWLATKAFAITFSVVFGVVVLGVVAVDVIVRRLEEET